MTAQFQSSVNVFNTIGIPGELAFTGPMRAEEYNLYSAGVPNIVGYAYTKSTGGSPNPAAGSPLAQTATVGGSGVFAGILLSPKEYASFGTTAGGPLAASMTLADYSLGSLLTMGYLFVTLPGPANLGDLVTYDPLTGALNSVAPTASFTASIAAGGSAGVADVMTVTAVSAGKLAVGQIVSGVGVETATIISLGTGTGYTGTYNLSTINQQTVSSRTMTAPNLPAPAFVGTATFATNVMTVASLASGEVLIGSQVFGAGIPANTVVSAFGTGTGGTGTYTLNQTVGTISPAIAVTGPANLFVPNAVVEEFTPSSTGGVAVIKLTN